MSLKTYPCKNVKRASGSEWSTVRLRYILSSCFLESKAIATVIGIGFDFQTSCVRGRFLSALRCNSKTNTTTSSPCAMSVSFIRRITYTPGCTEVRGKFPAENQ